MRVREEYEGEAVWDGNVYVFDLTDHPTAEVAYGWSDPVPGTENSAVWIDSTSHWLECVSHSRVWIVGKG